MFHYILKPTLDVFMSNFTCVVVEDVTNRPIQPHIFTAFSCSITAHISILYLVQWN